MDARAYKQLSEVNEVVGSIGVKAGHVTSLDGDLDFEDHFRMGGNLVRGFDTGGIGVRDAASGYLFGSQFYVGASAEVVYPIPLLTNGLGVLGAVFVDAGTVWGLDKGSLSRSGAVADSAPYLRSSIGTGLVWESPLGLIKTNIAYPLTKKDYDKTRMFSVSGGAKF